MLRCARQGMGVKMENGEKLDTNSYNIVAKIYLPGLLKTPESKLYR